MGRLIRFWKRLKDDWRDLLALLRGDYDEDVSVTDVMMATMPPAPDQNIDWFVWECEQYAKSPVFWFDHWRYEGTPWAYPEPTHAERQAVWKRSMARQVEQLGEAVFARRIEALLGAMEAEAERGNISRHIDLHYHPDPLGWAMSQAVH